MTGLVKISGYFVKESGNIKKEYISRKIYLKVLLVGTFPEMIKFMDITNLFKKEFGWRRLSEERIRIIINAISQLPKDMVFVAKIDGDKVISPSIKKLLCKKAVDIIWQYY